ncbi:Ankyrin repeat domain-containing protein 18A [Araneus ventricosus]|uniref:Ankyrin repeat domain-containing protein 18A n=1 Tax=Araneus ventricosus TaxID=182803 RepID=A0A4Y2BNK3_ARAVE|nr:Ankyrin repeat domain-containing protein 18A [Araneus ventricosus]
MDDYIECPLHWLVSTDDFYRQFQARLEDPNERDAMDYTLLHVAAQSPVVNSRIVQLLLKRGANVDSTTPDGHTPLHFAVCSRKRDTVVALIKAGASVNSKDLWGRTALHFSVCKGQSYSPIPVLNTDCDMWIVERLLCHPKTRLDPEDQLGETPLVWAVKERNSDAVRALLKKGANPNIHNIGKRTALHEALSVQNPRINIVFALLTYGAGVYCEDILRQTPVDVLVSKVRDKRTLAFAAACVWLIAFRYHIRECLKRKLKQIPGLYNYLNECCKEVTVMKKLIIYENVTLHDFALDCFQGRDGDSVLKIYIPVVEILLSGLCRKYFDFIFCRLSVPDLCLVLVRTSGSLSSLDLVPAEFLTSASTGLFWYPRLGWETSLFPHLNSGKSDVSQPNREYQNRPLNGMGFGRYNAPVEKQRPDYHSTAVPRATTWVNSSVAQHFVAHCDNLPKTILQFVW